MPLNVTAANDYIIAEPVTEGDDKPFETVDNQQKNQHLEVLSVGKEVESCKPGDKILPFGQEFQAFQFEGKQYIVLRDDLIIGVFN